MTNPKIQLEAGNTYRMRNGKRVGPIRVNSHNLIFPFCFETPIMGCITWTERGTFYDDETPHAFDIIAEVPAETDLSGSVCIHAVESDAKPGNQKGAVIDGGPDKPSVAGRSEDGNSPAQTPSEQPHPDADLFLLNPNDEMEDGDVAIHRITKTRVNVKGWFGIPAYNLRDWGVYRSRISNPKPERTGDLKSEPQQNQADSASKQDCLTAKLQPAPSTAPSPAAQPDPVVTGVGSQDQCARCHHPFVEHSKTGPCLHREGICHDRVRCDCESFIPERPDSQKSQPSGAGEPAAEKPREWNLIESFGLTDEEFYIRAMGPRIHLAAIRVIEKAPVEAEIARLREELQKVNLGAARNKYHWDETAAALRDSNIGNERLRKENDALKSQLSAIREIVKEGE